MNRDLPEVEGVPVHAWLAGPLSTDVARSIERLARAPDVRRVAVMPDVHRAGEVCVGVALATGGLVYPAAVGGDIGCGMTAARFDVPAADLASDPRLGATVLARLARAVPSIKGAPGTVPDTLPPGVEPEGLSDGRLAHAARREGRWQLGSLGRGNHFLELQADQDGALWIMIHSGSRGMGQAISAWHLARSAAPAPGALPALDAGSEAGRAYLADVAWARAWARCNRARMRAAAAAILADLLGAALDEATVIDCDHNHVALERHGGLELVVHRKGALPAADGQAGLVPGSMGTASFHTAGRGHPDSLASSSHGAGRVLARGEAAGRIDARRLVREMHGVVFDARRAARMVDEAPSAYRDIRAVMRAQRDLTAVVRELRPLVSHKGS
ncbi:MAG: RtcB family protein [Planctomycetaceae bacterium]